MTTGLQLPDEIRRFILNSIPSVPHLEAPLSASSRICSGLVCLVAKDKPRGTIAMRRHQMNWALWSIGWQTSIPGTWSP